MSRVVVVGGGVIGCAVAERLSRHGQQVVLLERDQLASKASGAAAGELSPSARPEDHEALRMFPELVARIERDSAIDVEYHVQQALRPAFANDEVEAVKAQGGRWLDATETRKLEPAVSDDVIGASLIEHAHLTPPRFVRALARTAAAQGAEIREGVPAIGFDVHGDTARRVKTPFEDVSGDVFVIAAGPWTREVASHAGVDVDVRPQRGQLAALDSTQVMLRRSIFWSGGYLVPKGDGTVIAGGTEEDAGFDDRPTVDGIARLLGFASRLVPALSHAAIQRVWAGLRPVTAEGEPIVTATAVRNIIVATGHHRKGILLAPLAALQVAQYLVTY
jgi:glycine oxidase